MKNKSLIVLGITLIVATLTCLPTYAKQIHPAEIIGRDLLIPGLGWAVHIGIATTYVMSPEIIRKNAGPVIEVLNENPVDQINSITHFKSRKTEPES